MAQRRMFSPKIVSSDAFLDMPTSSRELYFQLGMYADDDGFINPKKIVRMVGASEDDLKVLIAKRFVLPFENGVVVIKHWAVNNLIRKDWYQQTIYLEQKDKLILKDNGAYTEKEKVLVNEMLTNRSHRLGKVSIGKDRIEDKYITEQSSDKGVFSLQEEIKKLEENSRRDLNIAALLFSERNPDLKNYEQFQVALKRHLRAAKDLISFTDDQIIDAVSKAKKITKEWTLETLIKILTK